MQHSRKKSASNIQSSQRKKGSATRQKNQSPGGVSETASEKAVKDAMMKTTQRIYFPKQFKMANTSTKNTKKATETSTEAQQPVNTSGLGPVEHNFSPVKDKSVNKREPYHLSPDKTAIVSGKVKRAAVNLESEGSQEYIARSIAIGQ